VACVTPQGRGVVLARNEEAEYAVRRALASAVALASAGEVAMEAASVARSVGRPDSLYSGSAATERRFRRLSQEGPSLRYLESGSGNVDPELEMVPDHDAPTLLLDVLEGLLNTNASDGGAGRGRANRPRIHRGVSVRGAIVEAGMGDALHAGSRTDLSSADQASIDRLDTNTSRTDGSGTSSVHAPGGIRSLQRPETNDSGSMSALDRAVRLLVEDEDEDGDGDEDVSEDEDEASDCAIDAGSTA